MSCEFRLPYFFIFHWGSFSDTLGGFNRHVHVTMTIFTEVSAASPHTVTSWLIIITFFIYGGKHNHFLIREASNVFFTGLGLFIHATLSLPFEQVENSCSLSKQ
jgi:hypothetical protein